MKYHWKTLATYRYKLGRSFSTHHSNKNEQMSAATALTMSKSKQSDNDLFELDGSFTDSVEHSDFHLESPQAEGASIPHQTEFFLPDYNAETPEDSDQMELQGLEKPIHAMHVEGHSKPLQFHYAKNLLESLEAQGVQVQYQCREGYCGSCRTDLIEGEVAYLEEPMAWLNDGEILPCCCVPKSPVKLKLKD